MTRDDNEPERRSGTGELVYMLHPASARTTLRAQK
jgi:hypothetical protein